MFVAGFFLVFGFVLKNKTAYIGPDFTNYGVVKWLQVLALVISCTSLNV